MSKIYGKMILLAIVLLLIFATASFAQGKRYQSDSAWSFGVMGDTQWTLGRPTYAPFPYGGGTGYTFEATTNPDFISESIASQVRAQFIAHKVKFVFQMGDSSNWGGNAATYTNAARAQDVYGAEIGYFPMRGNHVTLSWLYADKVGSEYFPWDPDLNHNTPAFLESFPQTQGQGDYLFGTGNFSSPAQLIPFDRFGVWDNLEYEDNDALRGLSYSFDFKQGKSSARFVVLDTQTTGFVFVEGEYYPYTPNYTPAQQQKWISERLKKSGRGTAHAFVLSHQQPMGQNHKESMFGPFDQNPFFKSLADNGVKYYISGHDHLYHRSIVASPDLQSNVTQVISTGNSTKFYAPGPLTEDQRQRETSLAQELYNVGYYIYTVDGPRVTVDYYSDATGNFQSDYCYPYGIKGSGSCLTRPGKSPAPEVFGTFITPMLQFEKKETFGYSLNGKEFLVEQGDSYSIVQDSFRGSAARILAGTNSSTATDATPLVVDDNDTPDDPEDDVITSWPRPFVKAVNTGWTEKSVDNHVLNSDILSLWGMADFGTDETEPFVLSMRHDFRREVHRCEAGIAAMNDSGEWVNAVTLNIGSDGSADECVIGPYPGGEPVLGMYGIDPKTKSAWAVINYNSDFAIADFPTAVVEKKKGKK